jgi:hypothetical protein
MNIEEKTKLHLDFIKEFSDGYQIKQNTNADAIFNWFVNKVSNLVENRVMPKIAEVIENKKQKILSSLNEYLAETNPSEKHEQHLQIIADSEIQICNELLKEFESNFTA